MGKEDIKKSHLSKCLAFFKGHLLKLAIILFVVSISLVMAAAAIFAAGYADNNAKVISNWSTWLSWEECSVSCDVGIQRRRRTCFNQQSDPNVGNCKGESVDFGICGKGACPVNSNWGTWLSWEECSVSCDVGIQRRRRTCLNQQSDPNVGNCEGESVDFGICRKGACAVNRNWGTWLSWEACSVSCDVGIQRRRRTCLNQQSDLNVGSCKGESVDFGICGKGACADGGWTDWGVWGSCSATCNGGIRSRLRNCSNPSPSLLGKVCDGNPEQVASCQINQCPGTSVSSNVQESTTCPAYIVGFTAMYMLICKLMTHH